jgi:hypothetical protein
MLRKIDNSEETNNKYNECLPYIRFKYGGEYN